MGLPAVPRLTVVVSFEYLLLVLALPVLAGAHEVVSWNAIHCGSRRATVQMLPAIIVCILLATATLSGCGTSTATGQWEAGHEAEGQFGPAGSSESGGVEEEQPMATTDDRFMGIREAAGSVAYELFWAGESFLGVPLVGVIVGKDGTATIEYSNTHMGWDPDTTATFEIHFTSPEMLGEQAQANREENLVEIEELQGKNGTYSLVETKFNGMPLLVLEKNGITITIADVFSGDEAKLILLADSLVPVGSD